MNGIQEVDGSIPFGSTNFAKVRDDAAQLISSLQAAIVDPVMQAAQLAGFFLPVILENDQRVFTPEGRQAVVQEALDAMATSDRTGLPGIRLRFLRNLHAFEVVYETASVGVEMLKGRQLKGRPAKTPGRAPSLLVLVPAQRYAPPPSPGAGVEEWRLAVEEFLFAKFSPASQPWMSRS